ncbi:MAG: hypothetical protein MZW92_14785 [Comamonadaceae bacterium]|nr:hypothetical protein [Comamonadaceae bacterium]
MTAPGSCAPPSRAGARSTSWRRRSSRGRSTTTRGGSSSRWTVPAGSSARPRVRAGGGRGADGEVPGAAVRLPGQIDAIPGYPCYRTVEETLAAAAALRDGVPDARHLDGHRQLVEKTDGGGLPGYDIMVLKLTNAATPEPKPKVLMTGAIHAREYVTAELATRLAEHLLSSYGTDPDVTWFLDHQEVHLILNMNPGRPQEGGDRPVVAEEHRQRLLHDAEPHTASTSTATSRTTGGKCCGGSGGVGCSGDVPGSPSAASEPEGPGRAQLRDVDLPGLRRPAGRADPGRRGRDLHRPSQLRRGSSCGRGDARRPLTLDATQLRTLGRKFAYASGHTPQQANTLYATDGTTRDFAYGELGLPSYTFEFGTDFFQGLRDVHEGTIPPTNLQALLYAIQVVAAAVHLMPAGPDALSVATTPSGERAGWDKRPRHRDDQRHAVQQHERHRAGAGHRRRRGLRRHPAVGHGRHAQIALTATERHAPARDRRGRAGHPGDDGVGGDQPPHPVRPRPGRGEHLGPGERRLRAARRTGERDAHRQQAGQRSGHRHLEPGRHRLRRHLRRPVPHRLRRRAPGRRRRRLDLHRVERRGMRGHQHPPGRHGPGAERRGDLHGEHLRPHRRQDRDRQRHRHLGPGRHRVRGHLRGLRPVRHRRHRRQCPGGRRRLGAFAGWSGACTGTGSCQVTMTQVRSVTASFTLRPAGTDTPRASTGRRSELVLEEQQRPRGGGTSASSPTATRAIRPSRGTGTGTVTTPSGSTGTAPSSCATATARASGRSSSPVRRPATSRSPATGTATESTPSASTVRPRPRGT